MAEEKKVKDIMARVEEYEKVGSEAPLCDVLQILKRNHEKIEAGEAGKFHKTVLITDSSKKIIGKLSVFDLIRGLVPEAAKEEGTSRAYYRTLSSRALEVAEEIGKFQEQFQWLHSTFFDLVKKETQKKVKDVMSPVHPLLNEDDSINKAIYIMFKEKIRQPMVARDNKIIGVVNIMDIFPLLLEIAGDECFLT